MTAPPSPRRHPLAPTPQPLRWTVAEFHRLGDVGVFEGRRPRLIAGVLLAEGPHTPPEAVAQCLAAEAIRPAFAAGWWVRNQLPLVLAADTDPWPDIAVVPGEPRDHTRHPTTAALVVEVAEASFGFDTAEKRRLYARAGIADYWVVDLNGRQLFVYRDPQGGDYADQRALGVADAVAPLAAPAAAVRVADLLP